MEIYICIISTNFECLLCDISFKQRYFEPYESLSDCL